MSVYKKLNQARILLQTQTLSKSGENTFAKYKYFELRDFLPAINLILDDIGLCGVVSFSSELATLTLTDVDDGSHIIITSPMGSASLKGCHEVQNIGAVETYQRRYLWVSAFEIVEHDALEAMTGKEPPVAKQSPPTQKQNTKLTIEDTRFDNAISSIKNGDYTIEKLLNTFKLSAEQTNKLGELNATH